MTTINNDILLLEQFIKEQEQRIDEGPAEIATIISAITSIPLVLDLVRLALQKFSYLQFKIYLPELDVNDPSLSSILNPRGSESTISDEDIEHSPEIVKSFITFINKYGMKSAEALNSYNNREKLEFEKANPIEGHQEIKIAKLRGSNLFYQVSLMIMSIRQNLQLIFDESFEAIASGIVAIIDNHPGIDLETRNKKFYSAVVKKLAKLIIFIIVGISMFQSIGSAAVKSLVGQGVDLVKKGVKIKKFFEFIRDFELFLLEITALFGSSGAVAQLAIVNEASLAIQAIQKIKEIYKSGKEVIDGFIIDFYKERAEHDKARSEETSIRYLGQTPKQIAMKATQDQKDYYGDYLQLDNFLRQYIRMLLS